MIEKPQTGVNNERGAANSLPPKISQQQLNNYKDQIEGKIVDKLNLNNSIQHIINAPSQLVSVKGGREKQHHSLIA